MIKDCLKKKKHHLYDHFLFQLFFKNRGILNEEGFVLFVRKNAIIVLIPKFGLEGTVFFDGKDKVAPNIIFNEEVKKQNKTEFFGDSC